MRGVAKTLDIGKTLNGIREKHVYIKGIVLEELNYNIQQYISMYSEIKG